MTDVPRRRLTSEEDAALDQIQRRFRAIDVALGELRTRELTSAEIGRALAWSEIAEMCETVERVAPRLGIDAVIPLSNLPIR